MPATVRDSDVLELAGMLLESPRQPGVRYRLDAVIGEGAHGIVYGATRLHDADAVRVVVKILRPRAVKELAGLAGMAVEKEVAALMRLSQRDLPTPYVVRFLDSGALRLGSAPLELPWIAVEYVEGGADGVTLSARVDGSVLGSGYAFDPVRAHNAVHCMTAGLRSIHEVGVVHRDLTPNNVLASGPVPSELYKISDFGLARVSETSTFGDILLGTPGYSAPEQCFPEDVPVGPYTDVFSLACSVYLLLTGEHYFDVLTVPETFVAARSSARRRILDARCVAPALAEQALLCDELDRVLARATRANPLERPAGAEELAAELLPLLAQATR